MTRVDEAVAGRGERDQGAATVVRGRARAGQPRLLEPVKALGRAARREHQRAGEIARAQLVGGTGAAQRREHVVPAGLEPVAR